ncbi:glucose-6-phosphate dehydrogenase [Thermoproteota archaeon]
MEDTKLNGKNSLSILDIEPHLFIILGATGNLTQKKLFPALYRLSVQGELIGKTKILGVARRRLNNTDFRNQARNMLKSIGLTIDPNIYFPWCDSCLFYHSIGEGTVESYKNLKVKIEKLEKENSLTGNRLFYLALPPNVVPLSIEGLGKSGLNRGPGWTRLVVEKPFGQDLASSRNLTNLIHEYFYEFQLFRIDHFLGKETVQNLFVLRFGNSFFEHMWNREHIDNIQITVAEDIGIETRADYYDHVGALRDMVQNHLTQLLTLVTMGNPKVFQAEAIQKEKIKILQNLSSIKTEDVVFGQYDTGEIGGKTVNGYNEESGISKSSKTETYVAMKLEIENKQWAKVPIYIRTGKRMSRRITRIIIKFHCPPGTVFHPHSAGYQCPIDPNLLIITLQPDEGFDLQFQVKSVGQPFQLSTQRLHFRYSEAFGQLPDAYQTLLLDILKGDQTLFVSSKDVDESWKIYNSLLKKDIPVRHYSAGSWGPKEADKLLTRNMAKWINT